MAEYRYYQLQEYLQSGWAIEPPIFVRPLWHDLYQFQQAYHFIMRRNQMFHLLVVPSSPQVDDWVKQLNLPLTHL